MDQRLRHLAEQNLGLADSLAGLIAAYPSFTVPFVTWLLMGYFESIPEELEEAAMIDGATRFGAFYGWGFLMAGAVLTTLPVIAAYIYLQKYMVEGLTAGSVKG